MPGIALKALAVWAGILMLAVLNGEFQRRLRYMSFIPLERSEDGNEKIKKA